MNRFLLVILIIINASSILYSQEVSKALNVLGNIKLLDGESLKDIKITLKIDIDRNEEY